LGELDMSRKLKSSQHFTGYTSRGSVLPRESVNGVIQLRSGAPVRPDRVTSAAGPGRLSLREQAEIWSRARVRHLISGETLVLQNTSADAFFLVVSGRFEIRAEGQPVPLAEIGTGEPIGEIAFFSGGLRTATAIAVRDSVVLEIDRASFEEVARCVPGIYNQLLATLAQRLADTTARVISSTRVATARTVAVVPAGHDGVPPEFFHRFRAAFAGLGKCLFLTCADIEARFPNLKLDDATVVNWLNSIESEYDLVLYLTDVKPTDWTRKAIRQADQLLLLAYGPAGGGLNAAEEIGLAVHPPNHRRLVRIHHRRVPFTTGTAEWLRERDVVMHHHVSLEDDRDFKSLYRFFTGRAVGFVAGGGGGFGPAHAGIFKAFQERGVSFDILGGASAGAAVLAGFALLLTPAEIDLGLEDIFVTSRGFKHRTFPRYSLLDHVAFDKALQRHFRGVQIEDAWLPYFAVAADVDRAGQGLYLMRRGPLWKAVRASCSIPAVLPPMFTDDGRMLVDGGIVDNIPLAPMKTLKSGPNLVVHFGMPPARPHKVKYESIPGRWQLLGRLLNPLAREKLPDVPGPVSVLRRCLCLHQNPDLLPIGPLDLVLAPPPFPGSNFLDFDRHSEVFEAGYQWGGVQLDQLMAEHNPALEPILATRN
jgi:NTE family protein